MTRGRKFRLMLGLLICGAALFFIVPAIWAFFFSRGLVFLRLMAGMAWLVVGGLLCFSARFHYRLTHYKFILLLGVVVSAVGLFLTVVAILAFFGSRAHGLLPFYELIGIGPLLLTTGVFVGLRDDAG
jgi:hypothetical protein